MKYFEMNGTGREFLVVKKKGQIIGFCRINDSEFTIHCTKRLLEPFV